MHFFLYLRLKIIFFQRIKYQLAVTILTVEVFLGAVGFVCMHMKRYQHQHFMFAIVVLIHHHKKTNFIDSQVTLSAVINRKRNKRKRNKKINSKKGYFPNHVRLRPVRSGQVVNLIASDCSVRRLLWIFHCQIGGAASHPSKDLTHKSQRGD